MPRAVPLPLRQEIVRRHEAGETLTEIAEDLHLPTRTLYGLWRRYRQRGRDGLAPDYHRCAHPGVRHPHHLHEAALALKRAHPRWGAQLIQLQLAERFPDQDLPAVRTLQTWFREAGLQPGRARKPTASRQRGTRPHAVWQLDAKEQIELGSGEKVTVFSLMDEATGSALAVGVFPPRPLPGGRPERGAGVAAGGLHPLGAAGTHAGG